MKLKKIALVVLGAVLISALSVAGTMALLKQNTASVINTFQSYNIGPDGKPLATTFTLQEHKVVQAEDGSFTESATDLIDANSYKLMPGMVVPKDPFITIGGKNNVPARLFVEVVGALPNGCNWEMDAGWTEVTSLEGNNGGDVYVWSAVVTDTNNGEGKYSIIAGDKITVADNADLSSITTGKTLKFYAYLAQATVAVNGENTNEPAAIYKACFPKN